MIEASAKYITRTRELEKEKLTMLNIERQKAKDEQQYQQDQYKKELHKS